MDDPNESETDDGLEAEETDLTSLPETIEEPFDPSQIKISRRVFPINLIVDRIGFNEIDLSPEFQRKARIWDITRKSRLIESILLRIPLPVFYVAADKDENWRVVDGLQRLTTIYDFVTEGSPYRFKLRGLEYLTPYEDAAYSDLPRSIKRRIDETELNVNVIESGTPETVMFNIFRRLNTGGISLNSQEIRNALHPGPVRQFLIDLVSTDAFNKAVDFGVRDDRMGARELALRYCAFRLTSFEAYQASDLDGFLNDSMRTINEMGQLERDNLSKGFEIAMDRASSLFGKNAFRKAYPNQTRRSPINRALFESVAVAMASLSNVEFHRVITNADLYINRYYQLFYDESFNRSISLSTGSRSAVVRRFSEIRRMFGPL